MDILEDAEIYVKDHHPFTSEIACITGAASSNVLIQASVLSDCTSIISATISMLTRTRS